MIHVAECSNRIDLGIVAPASRPKAINVSHFGNKLRRYELRLHGLRGHHEGRSSPSKSAAFSGYIGCRPVSCDWLVLSTLARKETHDLPSQNRRS